ncbi:MAG: DUF1549 domain-containing protein, partial [Verrucomicrobiae bacterium]|nr:DUF1549 domain-containing protein [Verrucomicrobiae bacterium]
MAVLTAGAAMLSVGELPAADDTTPALLEARCFKCHGPESQKGDLRLDSRVSALRGGESGENVVVPGKSAESRLIERVTSDDPDHRMPPKGEALPASEVAALRAWIDDIPAWKSAVAALDEVTTEHWSYQPVVKPPVPPSDFPNPIDAFVAAGLAEKSLGFNPPADGRALLRRMHLDVTGLLPDGDEAAAFEADYEMEGADPVHQDAAAAALADRLLESPRFGERWARHWLDVVRFADSSGFETNHERPNAYHYRDYVIRAFNDDKPYDRFVFEQIAGDTVGEDAATGFLVGGPWDRVKGKDPQLNAMQRQDELSDMVNTTGTAFLGVTMICAKCHNHKFDPVSQTDFYGMQAAL